jgi:hypothetical protein
MSVRGDGDREFFSPQDRGWRVIPRRGNRRCHPYCLIRCAQPASANSSRRLPLKPWKSCQQPAELEQAVSGTRNVRRPQQNLLRGNGGGDKWGASSFLRGGGEGGRWGRMGLHLVHRPHQGPLWRIVALRQPPRPFPVRARLPWAGGRSRHGRVGRDYERSQEL